MNENMHPEIPTYVSRLPGLRLRWFLKEILDGVTKFREVEMKIDTLQVNMERCNLMVGCTTTQTSKEANPLKTLELVLILVVRGISLRVFSY